MASGFLGTSIGNGFFGFDPTPNFSATNVVKTQTGNAANSILGANKTAQAPSAVQAPRPVQSAAPAASSVYTGGSSTAGAGSAADVAAYTDQINSLQQLLGSADVSRNNGVSSIENSFNNQNARLNQAQSNTLSKYATQKQDTGNDFQKALSTINSNARNGYNSLQLLLGGTGSAGEVLAPFAVSQQANAQRGTSSDAYARNLRDLDTATADAQTQYKNAQDDLLSQKNNKLQQLISSIDSQKQNYLSQIGSAQNQLNLARGGSYATPTAQNNAIAQLIAEQQGLSRQYADPTYEVKAVNAVAPDLSAYQAQAAQLTNGTNIDNGEDTTASALAALLKQQQRSQYAY